MACKPDRVLTYRGWFSMQTLKSSPTLVCLAGWHFNSNYISIQDAKKKLMLWRDLHIIFELLQIHLKKSGLTFLLIMELEAKGSNNEIQRPCYSLREKCPNTEFFLVSIFLHSDWINENTDQKELRIWTLFTQWFSQKNSLLTCFHHGE